MSAAHATDERSFEKLVEPHRRELHAHCYRMLGSVHDADDALQDALLRAWKSMDKFEGRSALKSWLYRIATNTCLDIIAKRPKHRVLPFDHGPEADPHEPVGMPVAESVWVEPYPDAQLGLEDGFAGPAATYEQREGVELAFVAALQLLPPNQRAALVLREVLGFSAQEAAEALETSVQSVNSALQRARKTIDEKVPDQTQQKTLRQIGDEKVSEVVQNWMQAMIDGDVERVVSLMAEDAAWSMPPLATWFRGLDQLQVFLSHGPLTGDWEWAHQVTTANGQPAVGAYTWDEAEQAYLPFALNVFTLKRGRIKEITSFITRATEGPDPEDFRRFPDEPQDMRAYAVFERFGLPERIER